MRGLIALLALTAAAGELDAQAASCDRDGWAQVLAAHAVRYPLLTFDDTYKLLHQGVFGSEHAAPDEASARAWLTDEIATLRAAGDSDEATFEAIAPRGAVVRVHLRPYLVAGGDPDALLGAFLETARTLRGTVEELRCAAAAASDVDPVRWPAAAWSAFVEDLIGSGLPALHHSADFTAAYAPAYRVVAGEWARRLTAGRP